MEEAAETFHEPTGDEIAEYLDMINPPKAPGRFQLILFVIVSLVFSAVSQVSSQAIYYGYTPSHHCKVENLSLIPEEFDETEGANVQSSCSMYSNLTTSNGTNGANGTFEIVSCQNGWTYDHVDFGETYVTEFDLVCDKSAIFETIMTVSSVINAIATPMISYLADRFGRRKVFIITYTIDRITSFGYALLPSFPAVSAVFAISSIATSGFIPILIMYECLPMRYRGLSGTSFNIIYILFLCLGPLTGWLIHEWRMLLIIWNVVAAVIGAFGFWLIPESLTWLLSNGKLDEAERLMQRIAKFNKINLPQPVLKKERFVQTKRNDNETVNAGAAAGAAGLAVGVGHDGAKKEQQTSQLSLLREIVHSRVMIKITCILSGLYFVNAMAYGGLSYIAPYLLGNMHLNNFLMTVVELPAYIVTIYIVER